MWRNKKVVVTGAGGFIGSHLTDALVRAGADVTAMIRYTSSARLGNLEFLTDDVRGALRIAAGNIEDSDFTYRALEGQDVVLHLAALIAIPYSYEAPRSYVRTNVEGTLNVLEAARRGSIGRVVHTSTSEVYGTAMRVPIDETHPLQGQSPYSASKIGADKIAESYYRSFGTPVVTLRPFNTYGPRQSARAFIPTIISQAAARDEIRLGSLTPERDMTFVTDTVRGFMAAGAMEGIDGTTINLGTGETFTVGWFAARILALMGLDKPIVSEEARMRPEQSEVLKLVSDNGLARRTLDWTPQVDLDEGLRLMIDFVLANPGFYRTDRYVT
ncbi:GDP-mannose 4,6-dehydratase [Methylobacterium soli]|uniref:NAD-dependent epimerase/dehydratase family protein n=1 Tax=Methylobacterium soli TaxID=553447 RepID=A0A6L3T149_9HYPH|nr:GDP-mannose 4,6-dehydratase [Methylobacterium soli]KAB1080274.1 NAD-dependent epimerase/dehydratase family protein [Methylobacterium soli]GJE42604.1 dTDP-glucose 4,6-dehydratase [Methylobacterium soli]